MNTFTTLANITTRAKYPQPLIIPTHSHFTFRIQSMFRGQMQGHDDESKMLSPRNKTGKERLLLLR